MRRLFALASLLALAAAGCADPARLDVSAEPSRTPDAGWPAALPFLELSFRDPATREEYRIAGPYRLLDTSAEGLLFEGVDPQFQREARLLLFARGNALWALARIDGREFLTRVD